MVSLQCTGAGPKIYNWMPLLRSIKLYTHTIPNHLIQCNTTQYHAKPRNSLAPWQQDASVLLRQLRGRSQHFAAVSPRPPISCSAYYTKDTALRRVFYKVLEIVFPHGNWQNPPHPPLWHNSPPFAPPSSDILQEINCFALQLNISIHLLLDSLLFSSLNKWVSVLFSQKLLHSSTHQYIACCACSL